MEQRELYDLFDHLEQVCKIYKDMLSRPTDFTTEALDRAADRMEAYIDSVTSLIPVTQEEEQPAEEPEEEADSEVEGTEETETK